MTYMAGLLRPARLNPMPIKGRRPVPCLHTGGSNPVPRNNHGGVCPHADRRARDARMPVPMCTTGIRGRAARAGGTAGLSGAPIGPTAGHRHRW